LATLDEKKGPVPFFLDLLDEAVLIRQSHSR
jgi:hypothetical protein